MAYSRRRLLQLTGSLAAGAGLARNGEAAPDEVPKPIAALRPRLEGTTPITLEGALNLTKWTGSPEEPAVL